MRDAGGHPVRTTLEIRDDVLEQVKGYAAARAISQGAAASEILERGLRSRLGIRYENGIPVFDLPEDSPTVSAEHVQSLIDEL